MLFHIKLILCILNSKEKTSLIKEYITYTYKQIHLYSCEKKKVSHSVVSDSATPWTVAPQAPLSMGFSQLEKLLEWVAIPFSRGSSQPKDQTQVSCIAGRFFIVWATVEALGIHVYICNFGQDNNE